MPSTLGKRTILSIFILSGFLPSVMAVQEPTKPDVQAEQPSQPSCRYCPNPEFPEEARKAKVSSGKVSVEVTISEKGVVERIYQAAENPAHAHYCEGEVKTEPQLTRAHGLESSKTSQTRLRTVNTEQLAAHTTW